jgi:hypothetical protein
MFTINYDEKYDVLGIGLADRANSIGSEEDGGLLVLRDRITGEITGLTILGFQRMHKSQMLPALPAGAEIDYDECRRLIEKQIQKG